MRNKKIFAMAAVCIFTIGLAGCGHESEKISEEWVQTEVLPIDNGNEEQSSMDGSIEGEKSDLALEEELRRYRQEREDSIQESNGLVEGGSPDEDNYSFDMSGLFYTEQFDTREMTEAYAAARIYITDTLGIEPSTKMAVYMCIDPRILEIYDDEDKGVAAGYDNSNIFVCEYCNEEGVWKYLILVRDSKDSAWEVIHSGSSYKE